MEITEITLKPCEKERERLEQQTKSYYVEPIQLIVDGQVISEVYAIFIRTQTDNGVNIKNRFYTFKTSMDDAIDEYAKKTDYVKHRLMSELGMQDGAKVYDKLVELAKEMAKGF